MSFCMMIVFDFNQHVFNVDCPCVYGLCRFSKVFYGKLYVSYFAYTRSPDTEVARFVVVFEIAKADLDI